MTNLVLIELIKIENEKYIYIRIGGDNQIYEISSRIPFQWESMENLGLY